MADSIADLWAVPTGRSARLDELTDRRQAAIPIEAIIPNPYQPRLDLHLDSDTFTELVGSIRTNGLLQPLLVWQPDVQEERYTLIAGERRWRALRTLAAESPAYTRAPASIITLRDDSPEAGMLIRALAENVVRSDLSTADTASAIARLRQVTGWTYEAISEQMGLSVNRVQDLAAIARHDPVHTAVRDGVITQKQAIAIAGAASDADSAAALVQRSRGRDLAATKRLARLAKGRPSLAVPKDPVITPPRMVDVDSLPVARLVGGGEVARPDLERALQATCEVIGWWPQGPG